MNEQYYCLHLDDYSTPAFISYGKAYYGTMEDLKAFVAESHRLGMRVLLDLVYLHIGPNADVLKNYPDFVNRDEMGNMILGPWNFPMLNYSNLGLREYLWCNMTYYIGALNADGFRCDVGDQVRIMTPEKAKAASDYIVVGRPITAAADPVAAYERCIREFLGEEC